MTTKHEPDEFELRLRQLGKPFISKPEVAYVLGISTLTLWKWAKIVPEDMPAWKLAGGVNFLHDYECLEWCREFARKHPDMMARRQLEGGQ